MRLSLQFTRTFMAIAPIAGAVDLCVKHADNAWLPGSSG